MLVCWQKQSGDREGSTLPQNASLSLTSFFSTRLMPMHSHLVKHRGNEVLYMKSRFEIWLNLLQMISEAQVWICFRSTVYVVWFWDVLHARSYFTPFEKTEVRPCFASLVDENSCCTDPIYTVQYAVCNPDNICNLYKHLKGEQTLNKTSELLQKSWKVCRLGSCVGVYNYAPNVRDPCDHLWPRQVQGSNLPPLHTLLLCSCVEPNTDVCLFTIK